MCLLVILLAIGPRAGILFYWLLYPARWEVAFESFLVGLAGFLFLPWATLAYVLAAPHGVDGWDYAIIALGVVVDLVGWRTGGGYGMGRVSDRGQAYGDYRGV